MRPDQVKKEFENVIDVILKVFDIFGFKDYEAQISLRDPKDTEKYIGDAQNWIITKNCLDQKAIMTECTFKNVAQTKEITVNNN